jgi:hypothetical protein
MRRADALSIPAMNVEIIVALIALAAALSSTALSGILGLRFWQSQKLNAVQPLTEERMGRYTELWKLTNLGPADRPTALTSAQRKTLASEFRCWYYDHAGGLLLSENARLQWTAVVNRLDQPEPTPKHVRRSMSCLRTRLKQDIHVHDPRIDETECRYEEGWPDRRFLARWRADSAGNHAARRAAVHGGLTNDMSPDTAESWCDAWEDEADSRGFDRGSSAYWDGASAWIEEQRKARKLPI